MRNIIYDLIKADWPSRPTILRLHRAYDSNPRLLVGPISFAQTCRLVRQECLPILTYRIYEQVVKAQGVHVKPKFGVTLRNTSQRASRYFCEHLDAVFRPDGAEIAKRARLIRSVKAILVRKFFPSWGWADQHGSRENKLLRSLGFKSAIDRYVCLGFYNAGGDIVHLADIVLCGGPLATDAWRKTGGYKLLVGAPVLTGRAARYVVLPVCQPQ
ncbi:hypothetical protein CC86DRAFT_377823 [Ophiobolus disseminans]|uniref:Uncharacterized protein n=1 Tax=Ophiobolus disseminans TaxID=1469910 RepID=A0A6A7AHC4_9PLEO|nr:hypothetical protein CC86DRAFT_377823 [Ophiobolus disseminans]